MKEPVDARGVVEGWKAYLKVTKIIQRKREKDRDYSSAHIHLLVFNMNETRRAERNQR